MNFGYNGPVVSEEKSFEIVEGRAGDGWMMTDNGAFPNPAQVI